MINVIEHGRIRELRLNRPPANALTRELLIDLMNQVNTASRQGVGALILTGIPGMFSAGLDIPALLKLNRQEIAALWKALYDAIGALACSTVPICAALSGHAPAGGTVLAIFCDWRIAAEGPFKIGLSEVQVALPLPPVILHGLRRLVGPNQSERLAVRGLLLSPQEAAAVGLVNETVPAQEVISRAIQWSEDLLTIPHVAMAYTRQQARADLVTLFASDLTSEIQEVGEAWWHPETQAILRSLADRLTKKKP